MSARRRLLAIVALVAVGSCSPPARIEALTVRVLFGPGRLGNSSTNDSVNAGILSARVSTSFDSSGSCPNPTKRPQPSSMSGWSARGHAT